MQFAVDLLRNQEGVTEVTIAKMEPNLGSLRVLVAGERRVELVKVLVEANIGVLRVDKAAARLENIFLKLTHGKDATP